MPNFSHQNVLVTGGTRGIGKAIVQAFLQEGAKVYASYTKNDEAAQAFKQEMQSYGENLQIIKFDVSQLSECEAAFKKIESEVGQLHVLVNNSGVRRDNLLPLMSENDWDQVININLKGTYNMCKLSVLHFLKHRFGRIINISSIGGKMGLPGQTNYAASKAGQIALAQSLSKEVAKKGITVNCVAPGFIETELIETLPSEQLQEYKKQIPMKRFGKASEVAHAVLFLAGKEAAYITGSTLEVTGGL